MIGTDAEVIRIAGLLRGTESAVQAVSVSFSLDFSLPLFDKMLM